MLARGSTIAATWLALALGPIAVGRAAGQSIGQAAGGETVMQAGQCVAPTGVAQGPQSVGACAVAPPPAFAPAPAPASPPPVVRADGCASLINKVGIAQGALDRIKASHGGSRKSHAKKVLAAQRQLQAAMLAQAKSCA